MAHRDQQQSEHICNKTKVAQVFTYRAGYSPLSHDHKQGDFCLSTKAKIVQNHGKNFCEAFKAYWVFIIEH